MRYPFCGLKRRPQHLLGLVVTLQINTRVSKKLGKQPQVATNACSIFFFIQRPFMKTTARIFAA
ncbi:MAG: hypothetical protein II110_04805, partial [Treponema sp.]|nr:hypothetical protein [Treponema sp.]